MGDNAPVTRIVSISNDCRDYAWGQPGGISRVLGRPATDAREAELWLGAHPGSPSRTEDPRWPTLRSWEESTGQELPYLLKVLAAGEPLSLQAHPTAEQARAGYAREEAAGVALDADERSYKDEHAKPELILAIEDGFEALCGFRPLEETREDVAALRDVAADPAPYARWLELLSGEDPLHRTVEWLLSDDPAAGEVARSLGAACDAGAGRFPVVADLCERYPGDPGTAVAVMLNHIVLAAGDCLWLPAGNIHAYLHGVGMELMGSSDNVLRGGLTSKHIDVPGLLEALDFDAGDPPHLRPEDEGGAVARYRPASVPSGEGVAFELREVTGDAVVEAGSPAIVIVVDGDFELGVGEETRRLAQGDAVFVPEAARLSMAGTGRAYVASA